MHTNSFFFSHNSRYPYNQTSLSHSHQLTLVVVFFFLSSSSLFVSLSLCLSVCTGTLCSLSLSLSLCCSLGVHIENRPHTSLSHAAVCVVGGGGTLGGSRLSIFEGMFDTIFPPPKFTSHVSVIVLPGSLLTGIPRPCKRPV